MQRLVQTTIASDHTESAMSAIFVPNQRSEETSGVFQGLRNAGVQLIIELQFEGLENELRHVGFINEEWIVNTLFDSDYENTDTDLIASFLNENVILIEQPLPVLTNLASFLQKATGVAIGACVGMTAANTLGNRLLLFVTVPFGILIVGTASGVGSALELGLRDRLLKTLKVKAKSAKRTAKTLPKTKEKPETGGLILAKDYGDGPLHRIIPSE